MVSSQLAEPIWRLTVRYSQRESNGERRVTGHLFTLDTIVIHQCVDQLFDLFVLGQHSVAQNVGEHSERFENLNRASD